MSPSGFTLVEVLVVIAITVILAGIVVPLLNAARQRGHQTVCASNLRQLGTAVLLYTHDNDDVVLPVAICKQLKTSDARCRLWPYLLSPYVGTDRIFYCPLDSYSQDNRDAFPDRSLFADTWALSRKEYSRFWGADGIYATLSYGSNSARPAGGPKELLPKEEYIGIFSQGGSENEFFDRNLDSIINPGSTVLLAESVGDCCLSLASTDLCLDRSELTGDWPWLGMAFRHWHRANVVFVDGHVQALDHTTLDQWAADPRRIDPGVRKWIEVDHCK